MKNTLAAILFFLSWSLLSSQNNYTFSHEAILRGDSSLKRLAIIFSGDEYGEGLRSIGKVLKEEGVKASFFFTGRFYRNKSFIPGIKKLIRDGHYMGPHSDMHLLYCDWLKRDSLLVTKNEFNQDLDHNYKSIDQLGISSKQTKYFLPPYEWYNDSISSWTKERSIQLINFTPGTLSHTDYTTSKDKNYRSNEIIYNSIIHYEQAHSNGLNGFILLMHIGAGPDRKEKFYERLPQLIKYLKAKGYGFVSIDQLI
jgi:peptidoglycan/xylan/chitin deacetylase (PgdA/CDA1 family)